MGEQGALVNVDPKSWRCEAKRSRVDTVVVGVHVPLFGRPMAGKGNRRSVWREGASFHKTRCRCFRSVVVRQESCLGKRQIFPAGW